jgi:glycosyltransferase involved in cell wall biosynthesis
MKFSILIPTWNNLPFLKICINSIRKNSIVDHQIIVHVNEGTDGTTEWLKSESILFSYSAQNIGVCKALNNAFQHSTEDYIVFMNDDMYALPNWDVYLIEAINKQPSHLFYLSSTMIEPKLSGNNCVLAPYDFGTSPSSFNENKLLESAPQISFHDWYGSTWPPSLVHRELWKKVGGYSEEFSPGLYSDPDFSMKLWNEGVRTFIGISGSRVYHFMSKSTGRSTMNNGRRQFAKKWGMTASFFKKRYLKIGEKYNGEKLSGNVNVFLLLLQKFKTMCM